MSLKTKTLRGTVSEIKAVQDEEDATSFSVRKKLRNGTVDEEEETEAPRSALPGTVPVKQYTAPSAKEVLKSDARILNRTEGRTERAQTLFDNAADTLAEKKKAVEVAESTIRAADLDNNVTEAQVKRYQTLADDYNKTAEKASSDMKYYTGLLGTELKKAKEYEAQAEEALKDKTLSQSERKQKSEGLQAKAQTSYAQYYGGISSQKDYAVRTSRVLDTNDKVYNFINDADGYRDKVQSWYEETSDRGNGQTKQTNLEKYGSFEKYLYMTDEEKGIYNYLYSVSGKADADRYLSQIEESLNKRTADTWYQDMTGVQRAVSAIPVGVERTVSGLKNAVSGITGTDAKTSAVQMFGQRMQEEADEGGILPSAAYKIGVTTGQMLPSLIMADLFSGAASVLGAGYKAVSAGAKTASALTTGVSAAGNAYKEAVDAGYEKNKSRVYGLLIGASEAGLFYLLSGVAGKYSLTNEALKDKIKTIGSASARLALNLGVTFASEGVEEGLQEYLDPLFRAFLFDEKYDFAAASDNAAEAFLLGGISSLLIGGAVDAVESSKIFGNGFQTDAGDVVTDKWFRGIKSEEDLKRARNELAKKYNTDNGTTPNQKIMQEINLEYEAKRAYLAGRNVFRKWYDEKQKKYEKKGIKLLEAAEAGADADVNAVDNTKADVPETVQKEADVEANAVADTKVNVPETVQKAADTDVSIQNRKDAGVTAPEKVNTYESELQRENRVEERGGNIRDAVTEVETGIGAKAESAGEVRESELGGNLLYDGQERGHDSGAVVADGRGGQAAVASARRGVQTEVNKTGDGENRPGNEIVSGKALGIENAREDSVLRVYPKESYNADMTEAAELGERETGLPVVFVDRSIPVVKGGNVSAVITGEKIVVNANDQKVKPKQLVEHEIYHDSAKKDKSLNKRVRNALNWDIKTDAQKADITVKYYNRYMSIIEDAYLTEIGKQKGDELTDAEMDGMLAFADEYITEEIFADAYAGMNRYGGKAGDLYGETVRNEKQNGVSEEGETRERYSAEEEDMLDIYQEDSPLKPVTVDEKVKDAIKGKRSEADIREAKAKVFMDEITRLSSKEYQRNLLETGGADAITQNQRQIQNLQRQLDTVRGVVNERKAERAEAVKEASMAAVPKPVIAKKTLKGKVYSLFSVPKAKQTEIGGILDKFCQQVTESGQIRYEDEKALFDRIYASGAVTEAIDDYYGEARSALRNGRIYVDEKTVADLGDNFKDLKKRAFQNGVILTRDRGKGLAVDQWNLELAERFGGLFRADDTDLAGIVERIVNIAEEGKQERMTLAEYAGLLDARGEISEEEFVDGLERQLHSDISAFAEEAKLESYLKQQANIKSLAKEAIERSHRKQQIERQKEQRELKDLQQRTLKQLQWLSKNRNRAPEDLKVIFDEVLSDIDVYAVGAASDLNWSEKYQATWRDLSEMYKRAMDGDPNFLPSEELKKIMTRVDNRKIDELDISALQDLYKAAVGLRQEIYNRNHLIGSEEGQLFEDVYDTVVEEFSEADVKRRGKLGSAVNDFMQEQMTPMNRLLEMAGWNPDSQWYAMAKQLEDGERAMKKFVVDAKDMVSDFVKENEDWLMVADGQGKDGLWYDVEVPVFVRFEPGTFTPVFMGTQTVSMTPLQKVHLYLESKSTDNLRHMAYGGRTFVDKESYRDGMKADAFAKKGTTVQLAPETVKKLVSDLTPQEMKLARCLEKFYNDYSKREINRVSNQLYGYDKAMGTYYAPIYSNSNYTQANIGTFDVTAEGVSNMKSREYGTNPTYNISAIEAFDKSVNQTSKFVGLSIPIRNWKTLMNWRGKSGSMMEVVSDKFGAKGKAFIVGGSYQMEGVNGATKTVSANGLLSDLQEGRKKESGIIDKTVDSMLSNYVSATFACNPGLVLKQNISYPTAACVLGFDTFPTTAQIIRVDKDLIRKYTPELDYRLLGYGTPEAAVLTENDGSMPKSKQARFLMGGAITWMDGETVARIWPWAENYVTKHFPELSVGSDADVASGDSEYYKKVAEVFNLAVDVTQPMYDVMHRGEIMKSGGSIQRAFTMFKTVPLQQANALRRSAGVAQHYEREADRIFRESDNADAKQYAAERAARAQKVFYDSVASILAGALGMSIFDFANAWFKNKGKQYRNDDGKVTLGSVLEKLSKDTVSNLTGMIIGGNELSDVLMNLVTGDKIYDISAPGIEQLNDFIDGAVSIVEGHADFYKGLLSVTFSGGNPFEYAWRNSGDLLKAVDEASETLSELVYGFPVKNIKKYLGGLLMRINPEAYQGIADFFDTTTKTDLKSLSGKRLKQGVEDVYMERGIILKDAVSEPIAELYEAGYVGAVMPDIPDYVTVDGEKIEFTERQKQVYSRTYSASVSEILKEVVVASRFRDAEDDIKEKILKAVYSHAAEVAKSKAVEGYQLKKKDQAIEKSGNKVRDIIDNVYDSNGMLAVYDEWEGYDYLRQF